jgi:hypothetical protein
VGECFADRIPAVRALRKGAVHGPEHILPVTSVKDESWEKPVTEIDYMVLAGSGLFSKPKTG